MNKDITRQSVLFPQLFGKTLTVKFDQRDGSSDGGAILLKAADERLGLSERLAACIEDRRQPGKIEHTVHELLSQRLYGVLPARVHEFRGGVRLGCLRLARCGQEEIHASTEDVGAAHGARSTG